MSGHSHWAGIKHKKGINDAKRAKIFTKFGKLITIAARESGGDPTTNLKLKFAIAQAQSANMPKDNIQRAIDRGTGKLKDGAEIEEITYEAYGPGQVAIMIQTATDNRNRTVSEIKTIFTKAGGQVVSAGSVAFLFQPVGMIIVEKENVSDKESFELVAIDADADDIIEEKGVFILLTDPTALKSTEESLTASDITLSSSKLGYWPTQKTTLSDQDQEAYDHLLEQLDDHDDVQEVYDNL